ncbi:hypothetical protein [Gaopeijia maritima]|uniref:Pilus assembly protein PilP n=1 Tax=Gaopeijia maritima TaxID=3119007 RepID=A0ABU9EHA8_9BACT
MRTLPMWGALLGAALILPVALEAQEPAAQTGATTVATAGTADPEQAELAFEREVFSYPAFSRRNPFKPLLASGEGGPRWEGMQLEGILYDADPQYSIAIVSSGRANAQADAGPDGSAGETARLRVGQRWGNIRVLAIHHDNILIEVEEFGLTEQRTMRLPARGEGGQR